MAELNHFAFKAQRVAGGYLALVRLASKAEASPIEADGKPVVYPDELSATRAGLNRIIDFVNGRLVRCGEIAGQTRKTVESMFSTERCEPRTRDIKVVYRRKKA